MLLNTRDFDRQSIEELTREFRRRMAKQIHTHKVTFYKSFWKMEWRWKIVAKNGNIIASSSEGYKNKQDCVYNAKSTARSINSFFKVKKD